MLNVPYYAGIMLDIPIMLALCSICFDYAGIMLNVPYYAGIMLDTSIMLVLCSILPLCWHYAWYFHYAGIMLDMLLALCLMLPNTCMHQPLMSASKSMLADSTHAVLVSKGLY